MSLDPHYLIRIIPAEGSFATTRHPPRRRIFIFVARLIIFANGLVPDPESARQLIQPEDILYAADGGTCLALALGLSPSVVIGDMDSLTPEDRKDLEARAVEIQQYPRDKDKTDLELAMDSAIQAGYREILIVGALGGRLDQTVANLSLLSDPRFSLCDIRLDDGVEEAFFTRNRCEIGGKSGDIVSLIPWGGIVTGISTEGLRWPMRGETLFPDRTRGISNELLQQKASIILKSGLLLIIHHRQGNISP
jgi:thiamine pyrophosphokinase